MNKKIAIVAILIALIAIVSVVVVVLNPFQKPEQTIDENGEEQEEPEEEPEQTLDIPLDVIVAGTDPDKNEIYYLPLKAEREQRLRLGIRVLEMSPTGYVNVLYIDKYWNEGENFRTSLWDTEFQLLADELETAYVRKFSIEDPDISHYSWVIDHNTTFFLPLDTVTEIVQYHIVVGQTDAETIRAELSYTLTDYYGIWHIQTDTWETAPVGIQSDGFRGYFDITNVILSPATDYEYNVLDYQYTHGEYIAKAEQGFYVAPGITTIYFDLKISESGYTGDLQVELCTEDGIHIKTDIIQVSVTDVSS